MIDKKSMLAAMNDLVKLGAVIGIGDDKYESTDMGYMLSIDDTSHMMYIDDIQFVLRTDKYIIHYFYTMLERVELYVTWGMRDITLQVTPRRELTDGVRYSDSYCIAEFEKGNTTYEGYVIEN